MKLVLSFFIILSVYLLGYNMYSMSYGVGIIPNASDVSAKVKEKKIIDDIGYVTLNIIEARDYKSMPNFVKDKIGKDITITVSIDDLPYFKDTIDILISVTGDEKGQEYTARIKP